MLVESVGLIFKAPLVRAILEDRKTETRRLLSNYNRVRSEWQYCGNGHWTQTIHRSKGEPDVVHETCPYGAAGSKIWVRETWACPGDGSVVYKADHGDDFDAYDIHPDFRAMNPDLSWKWKSAMMMPRWASRITLGVVSVSVERLQDISDEDALAEGISRFGDLELYGMDRTGTPGPEVGGSPKEAFALYWESIYGPGTWKLNPWVWCVGFEVLESNLRIEASR